jgi:hypothetical protein
MADIVFVAIALAFFGLASLFVFGCDRIIGRETPPAGGAGETGRGTSVADQAEAGVSS